ncbi:MAG: hypothetical protein HQ551_07085 [Desulfobacteraceae bacterium]|nr:hypothetical protein [Desulfobacteraceae bacterium]
MDLIHEILLSGKVEFKIDPEDAKVDALSELYHKAINKTVKVLSKNCKKILRWEEIPACVLFLFFPFWWHQNRGKKIEDIGEWVAPKSLKELGHLNASYSDKINEITKDLQRKFNFTQFSCREIEDTPLYFEVEFGNSNISEKNITYFPVNDYIEAAKVVSDREINFKSNLPKDFTEEVISGINDFLTTYKKHIPNIDSFYFIPAQGIKTNIINRDDFKMTCAGGLMVAFLKGNGCSLIEEKKNFKKQIPDLALLVTNRLNKLAQVDFYILKERNEAEIRNHALKSAISAIMSRNMSHNIGSHILINLEKDGVNDKDIKYFLSYLRTRMDFLAQVATDWPSWSLPTRFLQDLMFEFLNQLCLLKFIGASEGLKENNLRFNITVKDQKKNVQEFKWLPDASEGVEELREKLSKYDRYVSILGGITGRQAFYVILENIIRNAAKHSYEDKGSPLLINIRLTENKNDYSLEIWDNVSNNKGLKDKINENLRTPIIKSTGEIERSNWGIAEMKISSAYLQKKKPSDLAEGGEKNYDILNANVAENNCLKYTLKLLKPKEVGVVTFKQNNQIEANEKGSVYFLKVLDSNVLKGMIEKEENDFDYEFLVIVPPDGGQDKTKLLKLILENNGQNLEKLPMRLFWVGNENDFKGLEENDSYITKRIAILDPSKFNNKMKKEKPQIFKVWLYTRWITHLRDKVRGGEIMEKSFYLYLKLTENTQSEPHYSDYLRKNYRYFIPSLVESPSNMDETTRRGWEQLNQNLSESPIKEVIENIIIHNEIPEDDIPIIAYPRHGADIPEKDSHLGKIYQKNRDRIIYTENLSGASPHFSFLASPPDDEYQIQKLALWLVEGGLLRVVIADERIGRELGDSLSDLGIVNIAKIRRDNKELKVCDNGSVVLFPEKAEEGLKKVAKEAQSSKFQKKYGIKIKKSSTSGEQEFLKHDILIIHQGILDKLGFWKDRKDLENWLLLLKRKIPFIIVTSGRGRPDEVPENVKFVPFSDMNQSFAGKHSTKFLLTNIIMHAKE